MGRVLLEEGIDARSPIGECIDLVLRQHFIMLRAREQFVEEVRGDPDELVHPVALDLLGRLRRSESERRRGGLSVGGARGRRRRRWRRRRGRRRDRQGPELSYRLECPADLLHFPYPPRSLQESDEGPIGGRNSRGPPRLALLPPCLYHRFLFFLRRQQALVVRMRQTG